MSDRFEYHVFLSHSSKDKDIVRPLAERLRNDGLKVWFDEWVLKPGDNIPAKIEEGLERSRVLVLCMSANAFGSDWAKLEDYTFRFRDPLNKDRRFIPLRLDNAPLKGSLAQFLYIDWATTRDPEYPKLFDACRPPAKPSAEEQAQFEQKVISLAHTDRIMTVDWSPDGHQVLSGGDDKTVRLWDVESGHCLRVLEGHTDRVLSVAWSPDGRRILSGGDDNTVRLWDVESGRCLRILEGHTAGVWCVDWSPDGQKAISGAKDRTVRLWDVRAGTSLRILEGHTHSVLSVAWSPDGWRALSGSDDNTVRLWNVESGRSLRVLKGHRDGVWSVAWNPDGRSALSGSADNTIRMWEIESGRCLRVLEGHTASIWSIACSPDGQKALSGASDSTIRLWDIESGRSLCILEGHKDRVLSVAWSPDGRRVLSGSDDQTVRFWDVESGACTRALEGHTERIRSVAWSPNGQRALSGSTDTTVRLWEIESGQCLGVLKGHFKTVLSVAWSPDGRRALSGADDKTVQLWDIESRKCLHTLKGHSAGVLSLAWSPDGQKVLSGADDNTVRLWNVQSGKCLRVLEGHTHSVASIAWSPDGRGALSGAADSTVRLWDVESGRCLCVLDGHTDPVWSVAWSPDGQKALSGASDNTVRLWDVQSRKCLRVLEGHTHSVLSVAWNPDGRRALSGAADSTVRLWDVESGRCLRVLQGHTDRILSVAWSPDGRRAFSAAGDRVMRVWNRAQLTSDVPSPELPLTIPASTQPQVQYTNAKVLLVGDTSAGKTGLSMRLAQDRWEPTDSTVGAWATHWKLPVASDGDVEREIWLWDFGGQADQRLIHQLYMEDTAVAVLVFDGQKEDLFETLGQWDRDLTRASRKPFTKLLAAGRVDAGRLRVSPNEIQKLAKERGFSNRLFETSAKVGTDCEELKQAILDGIQWDEIPWRSSPRLFKRLKEEIVRLKDEDRVLMRFNELRDALRLRLVGQERQFKDDELKAVLGLLTGPGVVWELAFGSWVLLQPERINAYAQAVIQTMRADEFERGCIAEERVLKGDLMYHSSMRHLEGEEERLVLLAMHATLVERGLCLREQTDRGPLLIFPSYYRRERPDLVGHPAVLVTYRFNGFLDDIYATLVVRLHHTEAFNQDQLWRYAADFKTLTGKQLGVKVTRRGEGAGELEVYFDPAIPVGEKIIFSRYVHEHLLQKGQDVVRLRHYVCPHCGTTVGNREVAMDRLEEWLNRRTTGTRIARWLQEWVGWGRRPTVLCAKCENRVPLWDEMEQSFASAETQQRVRNLLQESAIVLDNESRERALVGEVISTVALSGQISREFNVSDHGIDMEIEFKSDTGEATGAKLYLQLKSGDSYLRERQRDDAEVFQISNQRWADYWQQQAYPVMLVIRTSDGEIRWMDVSDWLKRETDNGKKPVKQIVFKGERFDVMSVRRWRDRVLSAT